MKKLITLTLLILFQFMAYSQQIPAVQNRFKLFIVNNQNEFLLVKWKGSWELPGAAYGDSTVVKPINAFLDQMAEEFGISIKEKKLTGVFSYYLNERQYPMIFTYYKARLDKKIPNRVNSPENIKWFPIAEGLKAIAYPNSAAILRKMLDRPDTIWGGAFRLYTAQGWKYETIENFYPVN